MSEYRFGAEFKKSVDKNSEEWRLYCEGVHLALNYITISSGIEQDETQGMTEEQRRLLNSYNCGVALEDLKIKTKRLPTLVGNEKSRAVGFAVSNIEEALEATAKRRGAKLAADLRAITREIVTNEQAAIVSIFL